jgi:hypothetical protein
MPQCTTNQHNNTKKIKKKKKELLKSKQEKNQKFHWINKQKHIRKLFTHKKKHIQMLSKYVKKHLISLVIRGMLTKITDSNTLSLKQKKNFKILTTCIPEKLLTSTAIHALTLLIEGKLA